MVENDNRFEKFKKDPRFKSVKNKRGTRVKVWVFYSFRVFFPLTDCKGNYRKVENVRRQSKTSKL